MTEETQLEDIECQELSDSQDILISQKPVRKYCAHFSSSVICFQITSASIIISLILCWMLIVPQELDVRNYVPQQIHLSLGSNEKSMVLIWATLSKDANTDVKYGLSPENLVTNLTGWVDSYVTGHYESPLFHYIIFDNLEPNTTYYYKCGDDSRDIWSEVYPFKTPSNIPQPVTIGCIGDLGQTTHSQETLKGISVTESELIILVGDLSYSDGNHTKWDYWWNMVQNYTVSIPWMFIPGNHENEPNENGGKDFISYEKRVLMMPGQELQQAPSTQSSFLTRSTSKAGGNYYYSFDYSWIHFIMLSSETDYLMDSKQYKWLEKDLMNIQRDKTPWVVATWHRPWYCSNADHQGEGELMRLNMEHLLQKYRVDFALTGHAHIYERTEKIFNHRIEPEGIYYFTIGDGGNHQGISKPWVSPRPDWSAYRGEKYGYSTFTVYNQTHLQWKMYQDDDFSVVDELWMVK